MLLEIGITIPPSQRDDVTRCFVKFGLRITLNITRNKMKAKILKLMVKGSRNIIGTFLMMTIGTSVGMAGVQLLDYPKDKPPTDMGASERGMMEITVTVTDEGGNAIPGVTVSVTGTTMGTATDLYGKYTLTVPDGSRLVFSFIGFVSQTEEVGTRSVIDVVLIKDTAALDEIVVTALGIQRDKKALTYATGELKGSDFVNARETNLGTALSAKIAGVQVTTSSSGR